MVQNSAAWVIGGGLEWAFSPHLSLQAEYLLIESFGDVKFTTVNLGLAAQPANHKVSVEELHLVRIGIDWRFGGEHQPSPLK